MKYHAFLLLSTLSIVASTTSSGCSSVTGFRSLSDGQAGTPELRKAAATARAEADALDAIADQQSEQLRQAVDGAHGIAESLGAPELVTGLIAGLGGLLVPSPIRRKKTPPE